MGGVVVVTFDENEEEKAIFRAYTLMGRVFVPCPSILRIAALWCYFRIFIISSSTASVYLPCAISLFLKESKALNMSRRSSAVRLCQESVLF